MDTTVLYYVHDPMCSWCWGYRPVLEQIRSELTGKIIVIDIVGGLARDTDEPMSEEMQQQIQSHWKRIEQQLGTEFNFNFWSECTPRRSTYPACRAVLAAANQADILEMKLANSRAMTLAIQQAYYLKAMNPSNNKVLLKLAKEIGLDVDQFTKELVGEPLHQQLKEEIRFARSIGGNSFPSWFLKAGETIHEIPVDYQSAEETLALINKSLMYIKARSNN